MHQQILKAVLITASLASFTVAYAQTTSVPSMMNFQGRLTKPDGSPVPDGSYSLTFRVYDSVTNGTKRWEQSMNPVLVRNGVFAVLLGNGNPITATVLNATPYLEIQIGTDSPLAPRQPFVTVSFAFKADTVPDGAIGTVQLANNSITSAKIVDGAVTSAKIADGAVTNAKIADGTITSGKLAGGGSPPMGAAGGDLTGTYPNPTVGGGKIDSTKLAADAASLSKVTNGSLTIDSGRLFVNYGTIQKGGNPIPGTLLDMGLYNFTPGWMRFMTNNSNFNWFTNIDLNSAPTMTLDTSGNLTTTGRLSLLNSGVIQRGASPVNTTDMGLYQLTGGWMRFVTNNSHFQWFSDANSSGGVGGAPIMTLTPSGALSVGEVSANVVEVRGSDVAELYYVQPNGDVSPVPGMIVSIDRAQIGRMKVASHTYDSTVGGIISGANGIKPGVILRQKGTVADGTYPVASVGRVWCWADADANGSIQAGDLLTTSATPGHAMRVDDPIKARGAVIGKAMSSLKSGKGLVFALVSLQ